MRDSSNAMPTQKHGSDAKDLKAQNADLKEAYGAIKSSLDQAMANNHQGSVNIAKLVDEINASNKYIKATCGSQIEIRLAQHGTYQQPDTFAQHR